MTSDTGWFKSSHSDAGNDSCVQVRITSEAVGVRDSKAPAAGELWLTAPSWAAFLGRNVTLRSF
jgi:uncharacterized protein DUF397